MNTRTVSRAPAWLLATIIIVMVLLHQDNWLWDSKVLVFGFLPAGLAYHAGYSILAALVLALFVKIAWPGHLENVQPINPGSNDDREDGH